jgi:hypothetical protein
VWPGFNSKELRELEGTGRNWKELRELRELRELEGTEGTEGTRGQKESRRRSLGSFLQFLEFLEEGRHARVPIRWKAYADIPEIARLQEDHGMAGC